MQKVIVQIDWYTKIILTLIAVLLAGLLAKPYIIPKPVGAGESVTVDNWPDNAVPVKLVGADMHWNELPVYVTNRPFARGDAIPVKVVEVDDSIWVEGDVDLTGRNIIKVVDWKEWEDYEKWIRGELQPKK